MILKQEDQDFLESIKHEKCLIDSNILMYLVNWKESKLESSFEYFTTLFKEFTIKNKFIYKTDITNWELSHKPTNLQKKIVKKLKILSCYLKDILYLWKESSNLNDKDWKTTQVLDNLIFFSGMKKFKGNFIFISSDDKFITSLLKSKINKDVTILRSFYLIIKQDKIKKPDKSNYELLNIYFIKIISDIK